MSTCTQSKTILLLEDDPINLLFFKSVLENLSLMVDTANSISTARILISKTHYQLYLLDMNLPDGTGAELFREVKQLYPDAKGVAHTALDTQKQQKILMDAGFIEVLIKPITIQELENCLRKYIQIPNYINNESLQDWDTAQAERALNNNQTHIKALRDLFLTELPNTLQQIQSASDNKDIKQLRFYLHQMKSSCGFVGAVRLGAAVKALHAQPENIELVIQLVEVGRHLLDVEL